MTVDFPATRAAALDRLTAFLPFAGRDYASKRNYDMPGHKYVSRLSPYLRHRVITEEEVLQAVMGRHTPSAAEKFIQEVCWRTYWKGVLERRPALWTDYTARVQAGLTALDDDLSLKANCDAACAGRTGIDCFDHWVQELISTGYLHNHARMWFASIWIFTLRLPWALGADFFLRHLLDGCPASNTLSWRWVGGLQTRGKTYLARPDNIAKYTNGRFHPKGLARFAEPLEGPPLPELGPAPIGGQVQTSGRIGLLLHEDALHFPEFDTSNVAEIGIVTPTKKLNSLPRGRKSVEFVENAAEHFRAQVDAEHGAVKKLEGTDQIVEWAVKAGLDAVVTPYICIGPLADRLATLKQDLSYKNIKLHSIIAPHDSTGWSAATAGFFKFKSIIPKLIDNQRQLSMIV